MSSRTPAPMVPLSMYQSFPEDEMIARVETFFEEIRRRRTVRSFSDRPVPRRVIEASLRVAGTAPSGANMQPWHFVVVTDPVIKAKIREAAEREERAFYGGRAPEEWLEALAHLGTDAEKPYLETAPILIAVFAKRHGVRGDGRRVPYYYVTESVGLAVGFLIVALHHAGLVTLTHTPSPMGFLNRLLDRPSSEKPFLLLVAGYPAAGTLVPDIRRKELEEFVQFR